MLVSKWSVIYTLVCLTYSVKCQTWELVFEDEFDTFDPEKWDHEITAWGGGNQEFQVYTDNPQNSYVQNGTLFLKPELLIDCTNPLTGEPFGEDFMDNGVLDLNEMYGRCTQPDNDGCRRTGAAGNMPPIMSARVRTNERFSFKHGRAEIVAKMPVGDWMWPALWLLPENWVYGPWPLSGEIDMHENIGNRDAVNPDMEYQGIQKTGVALHWGPDSGQNRYPLTVDHTTNETMNYGDYFHTYIFEWDENSMRFIVDDTLLMTVPNPPIDENPEWVDFWEFGGPWNEGTENPWTGGTNMAPFDEEFHFLMNVAVGGLNGFIPDNLINHGGRFPKPWTNVMPWFDAQRQFFDRRDEWYWTWQEEGDNAAMQVDSVRVYQLVDE